MIDFLAVLTKGGVLLFLHTAPGCIAVNTVIDFLNDFVSKTLIERGTLDGPFVSNHRVLGSLVFVCGWNPLLPVSYSETLLDRAAESFREEHPQDFDFASILGNVECVKPVAKRIFAKKENQAPATTKPQLNYARGKAGAGLTAAATVALQDSEESSEEESAVGGWLSRMMGTKKLDDADLDKAISSMRDHLVGKNVAVDIADMIVESVRTELVGAKTGSFQTVAGLVRKATESAVKTLMLQRPLDPVADVAGSPRRPFVIVFVGVNGVGKSTNLAKVAYKLLRERHRVLVAACDTFRSGAVEQLRQHVRNLRTIEGAAIDLYERGYGRDASAIAADAIGHARGKYDVVLVDTAGRMQDNVPLMRSLAKLVEANTPDRVIFVGEALVGSSGVDQLQKFTSSIGRPLDGIILSKFDIIGDKVGAALSMTHASGAPIVYLGVGQGYADLKRPHLRSIARALLS